MMILARRCRKAAALPIADFLAPALLRSSSEQGRGPRSFHPSQPRFSQPEEQPAEPSEKGPFSSSSRKQSPTSQARQKGTASRPEHVPRSSRNAGRGTTAASDLLVALYPNSTAASRPNPHTRAPLYGQRIIKRSPFDRTSAKDSPTHAGTADNGAPSLRLATPAEAADARGRSDPKLRHLYARLNSAADRADVLKALNTCASIRDHLAEREQLRREQAMQVAAAKAKKGKGKGKRGKQAPRVAEEEESEQAIIPDADVQAAAEQIPTSPIFGELERGIFHALLRCFSAHGMVHESIGVLLDMEQCGLSPDRESLDWALKAAVLAGDAAQIDSLLDKITEAARRESSAPHEDASVSQDALNPADEALNGDASPILASTFGWTPSTYTHMLHHAQLGHNVEYGLALLSAASQSDILLQPEAQNRALALLAHAREPRLLTEWAKRFDERTMKRLPPSAWMKVLRASADGHYLPGLVMAWQRAVVDGLLAPDEGLLLEVLSVGGRAGAPALVESALHTFRTSVGGVVQEMHMAPLFEAYCNVTDVCSAIRVLANMRRAGIFPSTETTRPLERMASADVHALEDARKALIEVGTDEGPQGGVDISAVNALIRAAARLHDLTTALAIHKECNYLRDASAPPGPIFTVAPSSTAANGGKDKPDAPQAHTPVVPDIETYNALLSACVSVGHHSLGLTLKRELHASGLAATPSTYQQLIQLCLTQDIYSHAFDFIEECKMRGLRPTRMTYELLIRKCFADGNERWKYALEEMKEAGHTPGVRLERALGLRGDENFERRSGRNGGRRHAD